MGEEKMAAALKGDATGVYRLHPDGSKEYVSFAGRDIRSLTKEEVEALAEQAAQREIQKHHAAGRPTCHADEKGIYFLHPDGRKEYKEDFVAGEGK